MKKFLVVFVFVSMSVLGLGLTIAADPADEIVISIKIKVSPNTIVSASKGTWVTVHTDIPYHQVDTGTVQLNGLSAKTTFADDCGNLVAKFSLDEVKAIVKPPEATLTLTGATKDGEFFTGSDTVAVRGGRQ